MNLQGKGIRIRSSATLWGLPLLAIALGPDFEKNEIRGHARGILAIGDIATGVLAFGGLARGVIAIGGTVSIDLLVLENNDLRRLL